MDQKPTLQITPTGKVKVTNGKDVVLLDADGNVIPTRNRFHCVTAEKHKTARFVTVPTMHRVLTYVIPNVFVSH